MDPNQDTHVPTEVLRTPARLHAGNVKEVLRPVRAEPGTRLLVDLADTNAIDSTALGELVRIHRRLSGTGGAVVLGGASAGIRRVLAITRLDTIIAILPADAATPPVAGS